KPPFPKPVVWHARHPVSNSICLPLRELRARACPVLSHCIYSAKWHFEHAWADTNSPSAGGFEVPLGADAVVRNPDLSNAAFTADFCPSTSFIAPGSSGTSVSREM